VFLGVSPILITGGMVNVVSPTRASLPFLQPRYILGEVIHNGILQLIRILGKTGGEMILCLRMAGLPTFSKVLHPFMSFNLSLIMW